jgi:hypothetical protein
VLLSGTPSHIKAATERENQASPYTAAELRSMLADARDVYAHASEDVKTRGATLRLTKYTAKGKPYAIECVNPSYRLMTNSQSQILKLSKLLAVAERKESRPIRLRLRRMEPC